MTSDIRKYMFDREDDIYFAIRRVKQMVLLQIVKHVE